MGRSKPRGIQDIRQPVLLGIGVGDGVRQHGAHADLVGQAHGARGQPQPARAGALPPQIHRLQPRPLAEAPLPLRDPDAPEDE
ncbi:hypothetical protein ACIRP3_01210 [Streptomyces sp. NPDC101209]|uniref:hypothetical protein n=1 Tax=Streptomyces sp. NPDC101209 TaxID=3366129 RepID=UPI003813957B